SNCGCDGQHQNTFVPIMPDVRTCDNNINEHRMTSHLESNRAFFTRAVYRNPIFCLLLILGTFAAYFPALHNGFVNFDDNKYIFENPNIQSGLTWKTMLWAATTYYYTNWHPITWISHAADISLFHLNPGMHHAMNILLHALNAVL